MSVLLLPAPARRPAVALLMLCVAVTAFLGARYQGETEARWVDRVLAGPVQSALGGHPRFLELLLLGHPYSVAMITATLTLTCLLMGGRRAAALVAIGIPAACVLTQFILKPLIHRTYFGGLAFPSGHATGVFAIAAVICVLLVNPPHRLIPAALRAGAGLAAMAAAGVVCVAVLAARNHYATDLVGGAAVSTATVLLTALLLDRLPQRS